MASQNILRYSITPSVAPDPSPTVDVAAPQKRSTFSYLDIHVIELVQTSPTL